MQYSLRSTFFVVCWLALLTASIGAGNQLACEAFVAIQYLMFAVSIALALASRSTDRLAFIGFGVGFASFLLLLFVESAVADVARPRYTLPGMRIESLARSIQHFREIPDSVASAQVIGWESVIRSAFCTVFGVIAALCSLFVRDANNK